jgi:hypothetical protein
MKPKRFAIDPCPAALALACVVAAGGAALAQTLEAPYDAEYTLLDLGPIAGLPIPNGGLTFMHDDPNTIVIGGGANFEDGMLYTVRVTRDAEQHITGFASSAVPWAEAPYNDGGVVFGPENVLFLSRFPNNELGQIPPQESTATKIVALDSMGVEESPGGLNFVPDGFPGAGALKLASWGDGGWYTLTIAADGTSTYNVTSATRETTIGGGPEGFIYVPPGSPLFDDYGWLLVSEWSRGEIAAYAIDPNGDPVPSSRVTVVSGLEGAEGAAIDPLTGDFLFSTFSLGSDNVFAVQGFAPPPEELPDDEECTSSRLTGPGFWHRQCLGDAESGFLPGRRGRGPALRHVEEFAGSMMGCSDAALERLGLLDSTCDALEARPAEDPCERAKARLAAMVLDVCSGRVQASCRAAPSPHCAATTLGGRIDEAATMILLGQCQKAHVCLAQAHD